MKWELNFRGISMRRGGKFDLNYFVLVSRFPASSVSNRFTIFTRPGFSKPVDLWITWDNLLLQSYFCTFPQLKTACADLSSWLFSQGLLRSPILFFPAVLSELRGITDEGFVCVRKLWFDYSKEEKNDTYALGPEHFSNWQKSEILKQSAVRVMVRGGKSKQYFPSAKSR